MIINLLAFLVPICCAWALVFIVILVSIFKRVDLEINTKLLWAFLILVFPIIGLVLYFVQYKDKIVKKLIWFSVLTLSLAVIAGATVDYYVFIKPTLPRDLSNEKGIEVSAKDIVKEFQTSESTSNAKYLNKVVEVTGEVIEAKKDQTGKPTVTLKSDDSFSNVFVTLRGDKQLEVKGGSTITVKGILIGYLSDVVINEGIVVKQ